MSHHKRRASAVKSVGARADIRGTAAGHSRSTFLKILIPFLVLALGLPFVGVPDGSAQSDAAVIRLVRVMESDQSGLSAPSGLSFSSRANALHVIDGQPAASSVDLVKVTPASDRKGSTRLAAAIKNPINVAFDNRYGRLLIVHVSGNQLIEVREDAAGNLDPATLKRTRIQQMSLQDPQGISVDTASGDVYILDAAGPRIVRVQPADNGDLQGAGVSVIDISSQVTSAPRGLAIDPASGHMHVGAPSEGKLVELTPNGEAVATRDISSFRLASPQGMIFAPSGDQTDDPSVSSLFLADSGGTSSDSQPAGQIVELSLAEPVAAAAANFTSTVVKTTDMSKISPPSPDPSGITYLPFNNRLMVSDGEVEETVSGITHFRGANVWELTLGGSIVRTANISKKSPTVVPMTDEPTGVTWNPNNGHYFFTEDGGRRVYDLNPGGDGLVGTSDDTWTYFSTQGAGNTDPEGIAFDTWRNRLFVADGVNREVYEYTTTGTPIGHFDVQRYGVEDPESVEFNPDTGTLFVMSSNRSSHILVETTITGALIQTVDISATSARQAAGLAYAPASNGSGVKRFYIVDRGIDNNSDPRIIDGKLFEITAPSTGPLPSATSTSTPTISPTATNTPTAGPSPIPTNTLPPSATSTVTLTPSVSDLIFADGFESGDLSAWTSSSTGGGDLRVNSTAALVGSQGMQAVINDNTSIYVVDDSPNGEPRYRVRFYFDPNSITMASGDNHFILRGYSGSSTLVLRIQFRFSSGNYQLRAALRNDASTWTNSPWITLTDAPHSIEFDWIAASGAGANNGGLTLWIDGVQRASLAGVDNDTRRIDQIRLGAVAGIDSGTRGSYYFDAFDSRRQSYMGP